MSVKTRTRHEPAATGGDVVLEDYLDSKGVKWTFHPGLETAQFDVDKSLNNQVRFEPVDPKRVDKYAEDMRRGDKFPPTVSHGRMGKLVQADGVHRLMASIQAKRPVDTYVIQGDARAITLISHELNARHGLNTTEDERVAAALSLPRALLNKASQRRTTDQRFKDNKIPALVIEKLSETVKWRLSQVNTDEGFVALTDLVYKAALNSDAVFELVTEINELRSSDKQVAWVEQRKKDMLGEISASGGGVFTRAAKGPRQKVNLALTNILNLDEDITVLAEHWKGADRQEGAKRMKDAARLLNSLARQLAS